MVKAGFVAKIPIRPDKAGFQEIINISMRYF
jgi:hypothetical protein